MMKKNFFLTLLPILLLLCTHVSAQTKQPKPKTNAPPTKPSKPTQKKDDQPKKGQSNDVQVFDDKDGKTKDDYDYFEKKSSNSNPKNFIKIAPLESLDGTFPIFFERVLSNKFSVELGLGLTTTASTFAEIQGTVFGGGDYDNFYKGGTGSFIRIGGRYYASKSDDAPEGPYLGVEFQIKKFKFDAYRLDNTGYQVTSAPYSPTSITNTDLIRLVFGYHSLTDNNFGWDYYIGVAWRQHTFSGTYKDENSKVITGDLSSSYPTLLIGAKIGLGF
jgi:hypothetical protein